VLQGIVTFPQLTVYDSMVLHNKSISFYINLTETQTWVEHMADPDDPKIKDNITDGRFAPCSSAAEPTPGGLNGSHGVFMGGTWENMISMHVLDCLH